MEQPVSVCQLLAQAQQQLVNSDSARLDAEILLSYIMKKPRETFYAHPEDTVAAAAACDFRSLVARRASGFPVAYLTGSREFWSTPLTVNQSTLIPRPETECLVETALEVIPDNSGLHILDLGTGSGAVAIAVARERPVCTVVAVDIVPEALAVARTNASDNRVTNIRFILSDWFSGLYDEVFDVILCNPPYVDSCFPGLREGEISYEPRIALDGGYLGLEIISRLIPASERHINQNGYLVMEHGYDQLHHISRLFTINNFSDVKTRRDYSGNDRVTYARRL